MITALLIACTMPAGKRITDWRWRLIARYVRRRDHHECRNCGRQDAPLHVHHVRAISAGGSYWPWNLEALCQACHERIHRRDLNRDGKIG